MVARQLPAPAALDDPHLLRAGTRLDEFEILRPLGVGGFGIVYLALDHSLLRQVALKGVHARRPGRTAYRRVRPGNTTFRTTGITGRSNRVRLRHSGAFLLIGRLSRECLPAAHAQPR